MLQLIEMHYGSNTILVEIQTPENQPVSRGVEKYIIKKIDKALDQLLRQQILEHCQLMNTILEQVKKYPNSPNKVTSEFGLQVDTEGNIYVTKISSTSSYKISMEWNLQQEVTSKPVSPITQGMTEG